MSESTLICLRGKRRLVKDWWGRERRDGRETGCWWCLKGECLLVTGWRKRGRGKASAEGGWERKRCERMRKLQREFEKVKIRKWESAAWDERWSRRKESRGMNTEGSWGRRGGKKKWSEWREGQEHGEGMGSKGKLREAWVGREGRWGCGGLGEECHSGAASLTFNYGNTSNIFWGWTPSGVAWRGVAS